MVIRKINPKPINSSLHSALCFVHLSTDHVWHLMIERADCLRSGRSSTVCQSSKRDLIWACLSSTVKSKKIAIYGLRHDKSLPGLLLLADLLSGSAAVAALAVAFTPALK
jgi:hypothetical protein